MAGRQSKAKKDKRSQVEKRRSRKNAPGPGGGPGEAPRSNSSPSGDSDAGSSGMMSNMRSGFKTVAGTGEPTASKGGSVGTIVFYAIATAVAVFVFMRYAEC